MGITREHLEKLNAVYYWLAEAGEDYREQADILRDIYYFLQNMLDEEAGIEQGYLDNTGQLVANNENRKAQ